MQIGYARVSTKIKTLIYRMMHFFRQRIVQRQRFTALELHLTIDLGISDYKLKTDKYCSLKVQVKLQKSILIQTLNWQNNM
jgi:hypothetical protein